MDPDARDRIIAAVRAVPRGQVAGYGEIARRAGLPGRARLVARVLGDAGDRALPWFRIVRSDGRIAFPPAHALHAEQATRLRREGVAVEGGRVRMARRAVQIDEAVWGPRA